MILHKNQSGFSIVELGAVLAIVGLLGAGMTVMYSEQKKHSMDMQDTAKLKIIKHALVAYTKENKYLPCPDSINGDGFENRVNDTGSIPAVASVTQVNSVPQTNFAPQLPATQAVNAQPAINGVQIQVCELTSGAVPYLTLGLTKSQVHDGMGGVVRYHIDQGANDADNMLDCPTNSACFFNNNEEPDLVALGLGLTPTGNSYVMPYESLPAFNNATLPTVTNGLGANNLRICSDNACSGILEEGLLAVLVAHNVDGHVHQNDELENLDGDTNFVSKAITSTGDLFNDQVIGIAANELRMKQEPSVSAFVNIVTTAPPPSQPGQDLTGMGNLLGGSGTNVATDDVTFDVNRQTFNFGSAAAGENVVVKFKTEAYGTWDQPDNPRSSITSDSAYVKANGAEIVDLRYDYTDNSQDGYKQVTFDVLRDRSYRGWNADGSRYSRSVSLKAGTTHTTYVDVWYETHEMIVQADSNGDVVLEFGVGTTANYENIDFTDIELTNYQARSDFPTMPQVPAIDGIPQTKNINNDSEVYIDAS